MRSQSRWKSGSSIRSRLCLIIALGLCLMALLATAACDDDDKPVSNPALDAIHVELTLLSSHSDRLTRDYKARLIDWKGKSVTDADAVELALTMTMRDGMTHSKQGEMIVQPDGSYRLTLKLPMEGSWKEAIRVRRDGFERTVVRFANAR